MQVKAANAGGDAASRRLILGQADAGNLWAAVGATGNLISRQWSRRRLAGNSLDAEYRFVTGFVRKPGCAGYIADCVESDEIGSTPRVGGCLLYTSDAADE